MPGPRETVSGQLDRRAVHATERAADALERIATVLESCAICWPRPCDPDRSLCRRNPGVDTPE